MHPSLLLVLAISISGDFVVFISSTVLLANKKVVNWLAEFATPFAAGALLSAAFLDFLREGVEQYKPLTILSAALIGIIFFFLLEGWLHWFHHHSHETFETKQAHINETEPIAVLAVAGNWLHNFIDGAAIAAAFLVSRSTGVVTTLAVAMHEIPREMADSGYLLRRGMNRLKVVGVHGAALILTAIGTIIFYQSAKSNNQLLAWLIGSTAGFFIYIAASDIIPSINRARSKSKFLDWQSSLVIAGSFMVGLVVVIADKLIS